MNIANIPFNWTPLPQSQARGYIEKMPGSTFEEKHNNLTSRDIKPSTWKDDLVFSYPVTDDPGTDKSVCAGLVEGSEVVLKAIDIPDSLYDDAITPSNVQISMLDMSENIDEYYPNGALGKTPASVDDQHQYFVDGDIEKDVPGIDNQGTV